jgi:hypothetical protein
MAYKIKHKKPKKEKGSYYQTLGKIDKLENEEENKFYK